MSTAAPEMWTIVGLLNNTVFGDSGYITSKIYGRYCLCYDKMLWIKHSGLFYCQRCI